MKTRCLEYLDFERDFFSQFIEGGINKFDDYLNMKRMEGVWGDDVEIQAMSEIYNRQIEIYAMSTIPLKTFHEESIGRKIVTTEVKYPTIKLSYHGRNHYNSIADSNEKKFQLGLLQSAPGDFEDKVIEIVKNRIKERKKEKMTDPSKTITVKDDGAKELEYQIYNARETFLGKKDKDLDDILETKLSSHTYIDVIRQTDNEMIDKEFVDHVKKISIETETFDNYQATINMIIENGYTEEEATIAYSMMGGDPDLMLQYLMSQNYG